MKTILLLLAFNLSQIFAQVPCALFENGYRDVWWDSTPDKMAKFFESGDFRGEVFEDFSTNNNRHGLVILYSRGSYADFRSDRNHEERNLIFLDDHPISIKYIFHFNWSYHINTAKQIASDIASKYSLPMTANQIGGYGNINLGWVGTCNGKRISVHLVWTEEFEGEATRYVAVEVSKIAANQEFGRLRTIADHEEDERRAKGIKDGF
ncbi:MAG: hypothetical protein KAU50_01915 [Candidatus Marinimicrobia bacterium]|nr:hypothetical protein [Candidatus Neomarinimicrobiota bacterium]